MVMLDMSLYGQRRQSLILLVVLFMLVFLQGAVGMRFDCCQAKFSSTGKGCESTTTYENETYYCVAVAESCSTCTLAPNVSSYTCYQCCALDSGACGLPFSYISTSSWTLICMIFAGSCCCCSIVFLSAEHSRLKEGITFREAYLLPIPLVAAELDFDDKDYLFPPDQPTAIARAHNSIDVPVAEPTENSGLVSLYFPEREYAWD